MIHNTEFQGKSQKGKCPNTDQNKIKLLSIATNGIKQLSPSWLCTGIFWRIYWIKPGFILKHTPICLETSKGWAQKWSQKTGKTNVCNYYMVYLPITNSLHSDLKLMF